MAKSKKRNIQAGMWIGGVFHPFRRSVDYDPDRAGDEYGSRVDATGWPPRKRKRRKNFDLGGLSDLVFLTQSVKPARRKKRRTNPGWIGAKAVRIRKRGNLVLLDIKR